jgi:hypothetical protein
MRVSEPAGEILTLNALKGKDLSRRAPTHLWFGVIRCGGCQVGVLRRLGTPLPRRKMNLR